MIDRFVTSAIARRYLVIAIFFLLAIIGVFSYRELAVEAYPDIADTTAQVITTYPGHAAEEVEQQVTIPLERELNGTPGLEVMRSRSTFGLSLVTLVFQDGTDDYFARARIRERLQATDLPPGATTDLDPLTSPVGEIFRYTLESRSRGQRELRELQRWIVVPALKQIPGIADVTSFGGETTQFQLVLDPSSLARYHLSLQEIVARIEENNSNAGGGIIVRGDQGFVVRGIGLVRDLDDLGDIVVSAERGVPVFLKSLGRLQLGALQRNGILGKDHDDDGVSGIVLLLRGQNPSRVLEMVHERVRALNSGTAGLPWDVRVVPYLDRTTLVETTLRTVSHTMIEGIGLVVLVLIVFLGSPRSAIIVAITIPLSLLLAFICMRFADIPANLLSLGAIDFGIIVDGAIVVMEAILRRREETPDTVLEEGDAAKAASSVARPIFFGSLIVITAYLPLFGFQRVEKKLFTPMAWTIGFALTAALVLALALVPGLAFGALRKPQKLRHPKFLEVIARAHTLALRKIVARPRPYLIASGAASVLAIVLAVLVGKGFLPDLDEGSIWLQVQLPPGLSLDKAAELSSEIREAVLEFDQVSYVVTQLGRNDDGTDSWTPSHIESSVGLVPYDRWPSGMTKSDLVERLSARLRRIPGIVAGFSQPMIDGVNDKIAGAHSDLVVKIFGDDLTATRTVAERMVEVLRRTRGSADVAIDQEPPLPQIQVIVDRAAVARYGVNVGDVARLIEVAVGGRAVAQVFQGERRYDVAVRFPADVRGSARQLGNLSVRTPNGALVPLSQLARLELRTGESTITRERGRRHVTVKLNLRGRDLSTFLADARRRIRSQVSVPQSSEVTWGGQFENQQRATRRLALLVPLVLGVIFLLLFGAFGNLRHPSLILVNVPLALLGGMIALHLRGMTLNVSSAVGFITLFGVSTQNAVILLAGLNQLRDEGVPLIEATIRGASSRLRAFLLAATVATLGMMPAALAHGIGSDVQRPLATVVVGGLLTATVLTLLILPALYYVVERGVEDRAAQRLRRSTTPPPEMP